MSFENPRITTIGGGTGSFTLLQELKHLTPNISAIVNMSDDGGSTGRLCDEYGVLPTGDVRQCLVALSQEPDTRERFSYRYGDGPLDGHSFGNLLLARMELDEGDFAKAVKAASKLLKITGRVIPVTLDKHDLVMRDGEEITRGEFEIGHKNPISRRAKLWHDPVTRLNPEAEEAIYEADMIVIAPGNLYGSLLPALITPGLSGALAETEATKVMITNLVTKPGQTDGWHVVDYVNKVEEIVGRDTLDIVLYNTAMPSEELLNRYAHDGELPVGHEAERFTEISAKPLGVDLIANSVFISDRKDTVVPRTYIRHDAARVGEALMGITRAKLGQHVSVDV